MTMMQKSSSVTADDKIFAKNSANANVKATLVPKFAN